MVGLTHKDRFSHMEHHGFVSGGGVLHKGEDRVGDSSADKEGYPVPRSPGLAQHRHSQALEPDDQGQQRRDLHDNQELAGDLG